MRQQENAVANQMRKSAQAARREAARQQGQWQERAAYAAGRGKRSI